MVTVQPLGASLCKDSSAFTAPSSISLKPWRTNLTGLSNAYNLYFVAHASEIIVHEPIFPTQELPPRFSLVVSTPPSSQGLRGRIDPRHPHAINNLVVDSLGSEEVLVIVRDDGDVDAYLTKHIWGAVERRRASSNSLSLVASELRPLLHRNVGNSAWGLAVHTEARLIAVSSNNHEFNIFAFGLADQDDDKTSSIVGETQYLSGRTKDEHIKLPNGGANIPSIAFCNTGHDPDGRFLLTTDISGLTRYWDLLSRTGPQGLYIGRTPRQTSAFNEDSAGWSVGFLDPRAFTEADDYHDAAFPTAAKTAADLKYDSATWDLTAARLGQAAAGEIYATPMTSIPTSSNDRPINASRQSSGRLTSRERRHGRRTSSRQSLGVQTEDASEDDLPTEETFVERIRKVILRIGDQGTQDSASSSSEDDADDDPIGEGIMDEGDAVELDEDVDDDGNGVPLDPDDQIITTDQDQPVPDLVPFNTPADPPRSRQRIRREIAILRRLYADQYAIPRSPSPEPIESNFHLLFANESPLCPALPCPIFIASVRDMYLLQPSPPATGTATDHLPLVLIGNAFKSPLYTEDFGLDTDFFERCSILTQIPSLGVVIVGNQKGRVAILSGFKTWMKADIRGPTGMRVKGVKWVYGLRLEAVLPFRRQEREGLRPVCQLYGVAVGKMQGAREGEERWRVMLMWIDETVLSYEIRRKGGGVLGEGLEGLVI
ncbi:CRT10-like protein [Elsinoe fawcettii]|nr:CRT10-like protein [Elsinoe fawcettii]